MHPNHFLLTGAREKLIQTIMALRSQKIKDQKLKLTPKENLKLLEYQVELFREVADVMTKVDLPRDFWDQTQVRMENELASAQAAFIEENEEDNWIKILIFFKLLTPLLLTSFQGSFRTDFPIPARYILESLLLLLKYRILSMWFSKLHEEYILIYQIHHVFSLSQVLLHIIFCICSLSVTQCWNIMHKSRLFLNANCVMIWKWDFFAIFKHSDARLENFYASKTIIV